jgi:PKD repeat protein
MDYKVNYSTSDTIVNCICNGNRSFSIWGLDPFASYYYDFGNGQASSAAAASMRYTKDSVYTVLIKGTHIAGCVSYDSVRVHVSNTNYFMDFTDDGHVFPCLTESEKTIQFSTTSAPPGIIYYIWDFGDSLSGNDNHIEGTNMPNPSHIYTEAGYYTVTLIVEDTTGCVDTMQKIDYVFIDGPSGDFTYTPLSGCMPFNVTFTPHIDRDRYGNITADSVYWNPDQVVIDVRSGLAATLPYNFKFQIPGAYIPLMHMVKWVDDGMGGTKNLRCIVSKYGKDTIWAIDVKPDFISEDMYGLDSLVEFVNTTTVTPAYLTADSIHWNYGNNDFLWIYNTNTESHNGHTTYSTTGNYTVTLTEYYKSCRKSRTDDIRVVKDLGIKQLQGYEVTKLQVYPNPANAELIIKNYEGGEIEVFSIVGQTIMTLKTLGTIETIDISHLASGMYFLKVGNKVVRFVKE